jgi:basic amino acid/polyamine antiporter, APA family
MILPPLPISLCFAAVGSRFEGTGGPYLYTRAAFGRFAAFEVGWMQWFTRASSQASVMAGIALALGYYWPAITSGWPRTMLLTGVTLALTVINVRGIKQSAWLVNALTIGKLVPLALFILVGLMFVGGAGAPAAAAPPLSFHQISTAALLLIFVYGGFDVVPVPAGEAVDPRRDVPFALVMTIVSVTGVMTLAQFVAEHVLPDLGRHATPIADAAAVLLGAAGAMLVGIGSVVSMTGNNAGQVLSGSRMLFALAEHGELPAFFGRIHPRYRTPANAVLFTSAVALALGLSGSFAKLAVVSALARLVTYVGTCASTLRLRSPRFAPGGRGPRVNAATFVVPLGPAIPAIAILVSAAVVAGATREQLFGGFAALAVGAILFGITAWRRPIDHGSSAGL